MLPPHFKTWFVTQLAMFDTVCMYKYIYIYIFTKIFTFTPSVMLVKKQLSFLWGPLCSFLQMADSKQWLLQSRGGLISRKVTSFVQGRRKSQRRESTRRSFGRWARSEEKFNEFLFACWFVHHLGWLVGGPKDTLGGTSSKSWDFSPVHHT